MRLILQAAVGLLAIACFVPSTSAQQFLIPENPAGLLPAPVELPRDSIVTSNVGTWIFDGLDINYLSGANRFYWEGYWGQRAVIANVEAGHAWNGHETLEHLTTYINHPSVDLNSQRQYDYHATMVSHVLNGRIDTGGAFWLDYGWRWSYQDKFVQSAVWYGMAPQATLWSAALATEWIAYPNNDWAYAFNNSAESFMYAYATAMQPNAAGLKADVINSSWGFDDPAGQVWETIALDGLARANRTTVVLAAGNHLIGQAQVGGPASGYNSIAVGALASDTSVPPYSAVAYFSNTSPNNYYATGPTSVVSPKTGLTIQTVRAAVDIVTVGDNLTLAAYGGLTGSHVAGEDFTLVQDPNTGEWVQAGYVYYYDAGGTSFASPIVAGGAALLVDVGRDRFASEQAIDGRVIKAVLLNSADKLTGWTNNMYSHAGVLTTDQGLDYSMGAGALNLDRAFDQYTMGTADLPGSAGGMVGRIGWDFAEAAKGMPVQYTFNGAFKAGDRLSATLTWFVGRFTDVDALAADDAQFSDLDLELWRLDGLDWQLVAQSVCEYNNVEHIWLELPENGLYSLRVAWYGENYDTLELPNSEAFAVAWSVVPEPTTLMLLAVGVGWLSLRRFRAFKRRTA